MPSEALAAVLLLIAITMWMTLKQVIAMHQAERQRAIAHCGVVCQGRVVAIQRPFLFDSCTRLYFDFQPDGIHEAVRACHIDRRTADELQASLPAEGALVTVRYLPHQPRQAVIGKLVSSLC
jgi:hypothetical protein